MVLPKQMIREPYTDARIAASIATHWEPIWVTIEGRLATGGPFLDGIREDTKGISERCAKNSTLPPERQILQGDKLESEAVKLIAKFEARRDQVLQGFDEVLSDVGATIFKELRRVVGDLNVSLAASQIRGFVASDKSPSTKAHALAESDLGAARAILSAPPAASGLEPKQFDAILAVAERQYLPSLVSKREAAQAAGKEVRRSCAAAIQMVAEAAALEKVDGGWVAPHEEYAEAG